MYPLLHRWLSSQRKTLPLPEAASTHDAHGQRPRRMEQLEPRQALAADQPIVVAAVYYEEASGDDRAADELHISFTGGAPNTELTHVVIDGHKDRQSSKPLDNGDIFFDISSGGLGSFSNSPLVILEHQGFEVVASKVVDGEPRLEFWLKGFQAGEILKVSLDVDEKSFLSSNSVAEGGEFEGSHLEAKFVAPHFEDSQVHTIFFDGYDPQFAKFPARPSLPADRWEAQRDLSDRTAGAIGETAQIPLPSSLSGRVYQDDDRNLTQGANESGLANVTITLRKQGDPSFVKTTRTDGQGNYQFLQLLPGTYTVTETQPGGYQSVGAVVGQVKGQTRGQLSGPDQIQGIELRGGEDSVRNDFAETQPAQLSGRVYHDRNDNGRQDQGEEGIPNVELVLTPSTGGAGQAPLTARTDAEGRYLFADLRPGTYRVEERQPAGYLDGKDQVGNLGGAALANDVLGNINLRPNDKAVDYDFGELRPVELSGWVLVDQDDDCLLDPGEIRLSGVTLELLGPQGNVLDRTVTGTDGSYAFRSLSPGVYSVRQIQPSGYFDGKTRAGTGGGVAQANWIGEIRLPSGENSRENNFCEVPPVGIQGVVFADADEDCLQTGQEPGIAGVTIELLNSTGSVIRTTTTTASGSYEFLQLPPGEYQVRQQQPAGYLDGGEVVGTAGGKVLSNDLLGQIPLRNAILATGYNFCEVPPASLSGRVFVDRNGNSQFDPVEPGISGVLLELVDEQGAVVNTTRTDGQGNYTFTQLPPGVYRIRETQPSGYLDGADLIGSLGGSALGNDDLGQIRVPGGAQGVRYDFGELPYTSLAGRVFVDNDGDCIQSATEMSLGGVLIELLDASGEVVASAHTDASGAYRFEQLAPGVYTVRQTQPPGFLQGGSMPGTAGGTTAGPDVITSISLGNGQDATDYNFCEIAPSSLEGMVFQDIDGDCLFDPQEKRLDGVTVELLSTTGSVLQTTVTDALGQYRFEGLPPGSYSIREVQPAGYENGGEMVGSAGGRVLGPNLLGEIVLAGGTLGVDYNFCEIIPGPKVVFPITTPELEPLPVFEYVRPPDPQLRTPYAPAAAPIPRINFATLAAPLTWHLSIVDAGQPRFSRSSLGDVTQVRYVSGVWSGPKSTPASWRTAEANKTKGPVQRLDMPAGIPVTGDFNGDGRTDFGMFIQGEWFIDLTSDGVWNEGDLWAKLGDAEDRPVVGDWDGDGKADIGVFGSAWERDPLAIEREPGLPAALNTRQSKQKNPPPPPEEAAGYRDMQLTARGKVRSDLIDHVFAYGNTGDVPIVGDWDGDGIDTIGIYSAGVWYLDVDGDGVWGPRDLQVEFGSEGQTPIVGDWNGDGIDDVGTYYRGLWRRDMNGNHRWDGADREDQLGGVAQDLPLVGDWDGNGIDEISIYTPGNPTGQGDAGQAPTAGRAPQATATSSTAAASAVSLKPAA